MPVAPVARAPALATRVFFSTWGALALVLALTTLGSVLATTPIIERMLGREVERIEAMLRAIAVGEQTRSVDVDGLRWRAGAEYLLHMDSEGRTAAVSGALPPGPLPPVSEVRLDAPEQRLDREVRIDLAAGGSWRYGLDLRPWREARARLLVALAGGFASALLLSAAVLWAGLARVRRKSALLATLAREVSAGHPVGAPRSTKPDELDRAAEYLAAASEHLNRQAQLLATHEQRLAAVIQGTSDGIWDRDLRTGRTYYSPRFRQLLGYPDERSFEAEFEFATALHAEDRERVLKAQSEHLAERVPYSAEFRLRCRDGSYRWFRSFGQARWDARGAASRFAGALIDVTERRAAIDALRHERDLADALIEALPGVFCLVDIDGRLLRWNAHLEIAAQRTPESASLPDLFGEGQRAIVERALASARERGRSHVEALIGSAAQVQPFVFTCSRAELDGRMHLVLVGLDIAERKRAEDQVRDLATGLEQRVRERTAELVAANRELESFSYSVSHDLSAPLRAIDGFARMLETDAAPRLDEHARHCLARIRASAERMRHLIDALLALARVGREKMRVARCDLSAMAREIGDDLLAERPERKLELAIAPQLMAEADPSLLRIALENLLRNAWKFTSHHASARIELGMLREAGGAVYFVRDDGAGFDMQHADKLFGAFQRLHTEAQFEGSGIGLAIVARIIQRHGGRVWAQGAVEQGATFYFTLTRNQPSHGD